jgi:hypothetical protein
VAEGDLLRVSVDLQAEASLSGRGDVRVLLVADEPIGPDPMPRPSPASAYDATPATARSANRKAAWTPNLFVELLPSPLGGRAPGADALSGFDMPRTPLRFTPRRG